MMINRELYTENNSPETKIIVMGQDIRVRFMCRIENRNDNEYSLDKFEIKN